MCFHIVDCLSFDIVDFILHYGNGLYGVSYIFMALFLLKYKVSVFKFIDVVDKSHVLL